MGCFCKKKKFFGFVLIIFVLFLFYVFFVLSQHLKYLHLHEKISASSGLHKAYLMHKLTLGAHNILFLVSNQ